jgi:hypothetical protein
MLTQRAFCAGCVDADGRFVVCGGEDTTGPTDSCECFDPATGSWLPLRPMKAARACHTVCRAGVDLLVAGGG